MLQHVFYSVVSAECGSQWGDRLPRYELFNLIMRIKVKLNECEVVVIWVQSI